MELNFLTPAEVIAIAFSDGGYISEDVILEEDILWAAQRWVEPVVGEGVIEAVGRGEYESLRPLLISAIAYFTRYQVQPRLNAMTSQLGLTVATVCSHSPAEESLRGEHRRALWQRARTALDVLSRWVDDHAAEIKEYDPSQNILHRISLGGGIAQIL